MTVYIVIAGDWDIQDIISPHRTYKGALAVWDRQRLNMIERLRERRQRWLDDGAPTAAESYDGDIKRLSETRGPADDDSGYSPRILTMELLP